MGVDAYPINWWVVDLEDHSGVVNFEPSRGFHDDIQDLGRASFVPLSWVAMKIHSKTQLAVLRL